MNLDKVEELGVGVDVGGGLKKSLCPILRCPQEQLSSRQPQRKNVEVWKYVPVVCLV